MQTKVFRFEPLHPFIFEIRVILSDKKEDILTHFVPPMGVPEIVLYIGASQQIQQVNCAQGLIKGNYNRLQKIDFNPNYHFISIALYPYGLKQLFNINANELVNSVLDVKEHPMTQQLAELMQGKSLVDEALIQEIIAIMAQYPTYPISLSTLAFIALIQQTESNVIHQIIKHKGIEPRTLQRNFKKEVGFTPKEFLRIIRMNKIEAHLKEQVSALQIVADFDFADQSHFIKEFKQLRSFSPKKMIEKKLLLSNQLPEPELVNVLGVKTVKTK